MKSPRETNERSPSRCVAAADSTAVVTISVVPAAPTAPAPTSLTQSPRIRSSPSHEDDESRARSDEIHGKDVAQSMGSEMDATAAAAGQAPSVSSSPQSRLSVSPRRKRTSEDIDYLEPADEDSADDDDDDEEYRGAERGGGSRHAHGTTKRERRSVPAAPDAPSAGRSRPLVLRRCMGTLGCATVDELCRHWLGVPAVRASESVGHRDRGRAHTQEGRSTDDDGDPVSANDARPMRSTSHDRGSETAAAAAEKVPQPGIRSFSLSGGTHIFAPVVRNRKGEITVKLHVNGTNNSRRFIHVYLWWARLLGPNYPISDDMLQGRVWKHLRCTCGEGILDTRGHRRPADPHRVCIGPGHYRLSSSTDLLQIVSADLCDLIETYGGRTAVHAIDAFLTNARAFLATSPTLDQLASFLRRECPAISPVTGWESLLSLGPAAPGTMSGTDTPPTHASTAAAAAAAPATSASAEPRPTRARTTHAQPSIAVDNELVSPAEMDTSIDAAAAATAATGGVARASGSQSHASVFSRSTSDVSRNHSSPTIPSAALRGSEVATEERSPTQSRKASKRPPSSAGGPRGTHSSHVADPLLLRVSGPQHSRRQSSSQSQSSTRDRLTPDASSGAQSAITAAQPNTAYYVAAPPPQMYTQGSLTTGPLHVRAPSAAPPLHASHSHGHGQGHLGQLQGYPGSAQFMMSVPGAVPGTYMMVPVDAGMHNGQPHTSPVDMHMQAVWGGGGAPMPAANVVVPGWPPTAYRAEVPATISLRGVTPTASKAAHLGGHAQPATHAKHAAGSVGENDGGRGAGGAAAGASNRNGTQSSELQKSTHDGAPGKQGMVMSQLHPTMTYTPHDGRSAPPAQPANFTWTADVTAATHPHHLGHPGGLPPGAVATPVAWPGMQQGYPMPYMMIPPNMPLLYQPSGGVAWAASSSVQAALTPGVTVSVIAAAPNPEIVVPTGHSGQAALTRTPSVTVVATRFS